MDMKWFTIKGLRGVSLLFLMMTGTGIAQAQEQTDTVFIMQHDTLCQQVFPQPENTILQSRVPTADMTGASTAIAKIGQH